MSGGIRAIPVTVSQVSFTTWRMRSVQNAHLEALELWPWAMALYPDSQYHSLTS